MSDAEERDRQLQFEKEVKNHRQAIESLKITTQTLLASMYSLIRVLISEGNLDKGTFLSMFQVNVKEEKDNAWLFEELTKMEDELHGKLQDNE